MCEKTEFNKDNSIQSLMRVDRLHYACVDMGINALGLDLHRKQHAMLLFLNKSKTDISQKDMAKHFGISAAAIANTIKVLENNGYIKRITDSADSRRNIVEITDKGAEIIAKSEDVFHYVDNAMIEGISEDELNTFKSCLNKMADNLMNICGKKEEEK